MAAMTYIRKIWPALVLLTLAPSLPAQQPTPTLDTVLARVRANIDDYRTSVPNFSCDESVDSQRLERKDKRRDEGSVLLSHHPHRA